MAPWQGIGTGRVMLAFVLCFAVGFERELRDTVYWVALLRDVGCTGHAQC